MKRFKSAAKSGAYKKPQSAYKMKFRVYASTSEILWKGIADTPLFDDLKNEKYDEISIRDRDIVKLCFDGSVERSKFVYRECIDMYCDWHGYRKEHGLFDEDYCQTYIEDLKSAACGLGYSPDDVDSL